MRISVFDNQHAAVKELPRERRGEFWCAFFDYVFDGVSPCFSEPMERMAWNLVLPYIEKSKTAVQNGEKGGRKPRVKTKAKNQAEKPSTETQDGNRALLEKENEREGLGESLKDSLTPSPAGDGAGAGKPAPPPDGEEAVFAAVEAMEPGEHPEVARARALKAANDAKLAAWEAECTPCPPHLRAAPC